MMSNNKILTVSYGTFSCTLEGFDDSFGTMKAIAEYFRDLAADDRYFGAEPPQPDAEMLARIAQKEISRKVEAHQRDGRIVLSARRDHDAEIVQEAGPQPALAGADVLTPLTAVDLPDDITDALTAETSDAQTSEAAAVEPAQEAAPADDAPLPESGADGAEVAADDGDDAVSEAAQPASDVDEPEQADIPELERTAALEIDTERAEASTPEPVEAVQAEAAENESEPMLAGVDELAEAFFADSDETAMAEDEDQDAPAPVAARAPAADSIAAKLQRIRAVVARHEDDDAEDDYEDEEAATPAASAASADDRLDVVATARRDIEDALDADDAANTEYGELDDENDDDDIAAILSRLDEVETGADDTPLTDDADTEENLFDDSDDVAAEAAEDNADSAPIAKVRVVDGLRIEVEKTPERAEGQTGPTRARVIKVKRVDLEAAIEKGDLEEYPEEEEVTLPSSSLSAEDEDDLARELAALEAELYGPDDSPVPVRELPQTRRPQAPLPEPRAEEPAAVVKADRRPEPTVRHVLPSIDADSGADMKRLLAETDHKMHEPESATRRDAFAHLRAAVAAKKADEAMGHVKDESDKGDAYRSDLADVVRPRRPVGSNVRTARPGEARPGPLKLVAEQRIDTNAERPAGPVRPRRVTSVADKTPAADADSFADFAAEMGATRLPELLEAAAAYMSFVEGREQFSRPQLMNKVRQAGPDGFSREDGLRSFGQLLRTGKIEKIKGGRFTVSEDIGFRPDDRAVG